MIVFSRNDVGGKTKIIQRGTVYDYYSWIEVDNGCVKWRVLELHVVDLCVKLLQCQYHIDKGQLFQMGLSAKESYILHTRYRANTLKLLLFSNCILLRKLEKSSWAATAMILYNAIENQNTLIKDQPKYCSANGSLLL